jgi:DNA-binding transcriptional regulator YdaS (Cro superfamily)
MELIEYFSTQPRGTKVSMTKALGISKTWLSLVISKRKKPSPKLATEIEKATAGKVTREELRPDIFRRKKQ